jgi:hypothetical protein
LPSAAEFQEWASKNHPDKKFQYYSEKPASLPEWGKPGTDFIAGAWDGICFVYYQSWDKKTYDGAIQ